jgi:hypothetical protein
MRHLKIRLSATLTVIRSVVFTDNSVMLLSQNRENFSPQEREILKKADQF